MLFLIIHRAKRLTGFRFVFSLKTVFDFTASRLAAITNSKILSSWIAFDLAFVLQKDTSEASAIAFDFAFDFALNSLFILLKSF